MSHARGATKMVALRPGGQVDLIELEAVGESYGRDFLPHPFGHTQPSPFASYQEYGAYAADVLDRYRNGALQDLRRWFTSFIEADIRVECVVSKGIAPPTRLVAHRLGQDGFLAVQRPGEDVVDFSTLSAYELGAAVATSVGLTQPGKHPRIVIPEYDRRAAQSGDVDEGFSVQHRVTAHTAAVVPSTRPAAFGRAQSRWRPARNWGFDRSKNAVAWVHVDDDGDYIYAPGFDYLVPVSAARLGQRIDELIAEEVVLIRESRGL